MQKKWFRILGPLLFLSNIVLYSQSYFPAISWLQDVHTKGTVYQGVAAPVIVDIQAHFGPNGEVMFYLQSDVAKATPWIRELHAQGKKYWVNLASDVIEGYNMDSILADNPELSGPDFGAVISLEGIVSDRKSINRQEWRDFLIKCIKRAIDAGADGSQHDGAAPHYDSFDNEDLAAFEQYVIDHGINTGDWDYNTTTFKEYLLSKGKNDNNVFQTDNDPPNVKYLIEVWLDFKAEKTLESWQYIKQQCQAYAASQGKEYTLALNAASDFGGRNGLVYQAADYYIGEFFDWGNYFPMSGLLTVRSRMAMAFGKRFISWSPPTLEDISSDPNYDYGEMLIAEAEKAQIAQLYASGGIRQLVPPADKTYPAYDLTLLNRDLLNSVVPAGKIGVIMSQAQNIYHSNNWQGLLLVLQDLSRSFQLLFVKSNRLGLSDNLTLADLQKYEVIFLPEIFYLTDNQRSLLLQYMYAGGTVIGVRGNVEYVGYYDEWENIQTDPTWANLVNQSNSGIYLYGAGKFVNIAHYLTDEFGNLLSFYGVAYQSYKGDPINGSIAKSIRDTIAKWINVAFPEKDVVPVREISPYIRFFRYQDTLNHQYVYHILADSVNLATREAIPTDTFSVELKVADFSKNQTFRVTFHTMDQPNGVELISSITPDPQTGRIRITIPSFQRWGFIHLNGNGQMQSTVRLSNLRINGNSQFRRLKSGSSVNASWDVLSGFPDFYELEVWTNLNNVGTPVVDDQIQGGTTDGGNPPRQTPDMYQIMKNAKRIVFSKLQATETSYTINGNLLRDSLVYLLRVRGIQNTDTSDWISQFFYRNARPGAPYESQIYVAHQNLWYYTDHSYVTDTSYHPIIAFKKAPYYGGDYELDSLLFGFFVYTDSLTGKQGDTSSTLYSIGSQFKHKLAYNQETPNWVSDIQDTVDFSLEAYENFGIYFRAVATDLIDTSDYSPWFWLYLDNHNDPPNPFHLISPSDGYITSVEVPFVFKNNGDPDPLNLTNFTISRVEILFDSVSTFDSEGLVTYSRDPIGKEYEKDSISIDLPSNFFQVSGLSTYKKVYWKVRMYDYNRHTPDGSNPAFRESSDIFTLYIQQNSQTLNPPVLIQPIDGTVDLPLNVHFSWNPVPNAQNYTLQVATDTNFTQIVLNVSKLKNTNFISNKLLPNTKYYWRVRAGNRNGISNWSVVWHFTTMGLPEAVTLLEPLPNAIIQADSVLFKWNHTEPRVSEYRLEYADNAKMNNSITIDGIPDTLLVLKNLMQGKTYYWHVQARNDIGLGPYSETRSFTVNLLGIDISNIINTFYLSQNYPNPFNTITDILYSIPKPSQVTIELYNLKGQKIQTLINDFNEVGIYRLKINMTNFPSGIYFYRMKAKDFEAIKKMLFLK